MKARNDWRWAIVPALLWCMSALADEDSGATAFAAGDYEQAREIWQTDAMMGSPLAQYNLGYLYHSGTGVEPNYDIAVMWYEQAVKAECRAAQCNLGNMYMNGLGVQVDHDNAISLFASCVKSGGICRENMGSLYKFAEERMAWYGERDYVKAQMLLARLAQGNGQFSTMAAWLEKAADNGHGPAKIALGNCYLYGDGVDPDLGKGAGLVFGAMIQYRNDLETLSSAKSTLALGYRKAVITSDSRNIAAYVWGELAFRDSLGSDTTSSNLYKTIANEAADRMVDHEFSKASEILGEWVELFASGLPGVTEEHLRTLRIPGSASAPRDDESKSETKNRSPGQRPTAGT